MSGLDSFSWDDIEGVSGMSDLMNMPGMQDRLAQELGSTGLGAEAEKSLGLTDGEVKFFERANETEERGEEDYHIDFTGCFTVDDTMVMSGEAPLEGGFSADFGNFYGPRKAELWLSEPLDESLRPVFEEFFSSTFDDAHTRMSVDPEFFSEYAGGPRWGDYAEVVIEDPDAEDDDENAMFDF